ncbi:neuropeptide Y receptor type 2 [Perca fluviatilis]|uniref:neuropeptide Y receptor type 2 n=1 Tax=Perca fluviatilis TaxID=8168 RepID=UPI0019654AEF|nr:neuropeptide Y receptor type 2 [Perca fluviatilis]
MESDFWRLSAMDSADQLNMTQVEEFQLEPKSSNCCSTTGTVNDEPFLKLDDSTKLVGVRVSLILAYSTIILFGVIGNSLVIYVVCKFKHLRTVNNFFIVNLAVADLLVNALCLPFTLVNTLYGEWKFGQVLCFMLPYSQGLAVHVSTITMNVIAVDRHRSIVYHMETKMSKDMCAVVIVITWAVSALLASPLAIFREYGTFVILPHLSIQVCTEHWPGSSANGSIYSISVLLVQCGLPLAINCVAYISIWNKLNNRVVYIGRNDRRLHRKKTTKMLVTMVVVFAVSWLPLHAFQLAVDIDSTLLFMKDFKLLFTVFHIVAMCSTFVNPILYGWMNNNYRVAFLSVCKCYHPFSSQLGHSKSRETQKNEDGVCTDCKSTNV